MEYSEREIIDLLKAGDTRVFEWLFKQYYAALRIYAHRLVGELDLSEEVVAASFAAVWERRSRIDFDHSVKSYLFRTVHNRCLNHIKQQQVRKRYERYLLEQSLPGAEEAEAELSLGADDLRREIGLALDELPEKCRQIFLLSRFGNKKYHEIAAMLELSPKTVETQMSIALRKLRERLREWLPVLF